jgi:hypothetical protein
MCGSLNQTTMLHKISRHLTEYEHFFSAYYSDGAERIAAKTGLLDFSVLGGKFRKQTEDYLYANSLNNDYEGRKFNYDLVVICSDLIVPKNIRNKKIVMVQEGMTDPENIFYHIVKRVKLLPRYFGGTAATGLSDSYNFFCVASENYKKLFIQKGVKSEKIIVTGIPNFDNCEEFLKNDFPYKNYSLVCSSDSRETYKYEDRKKFIQKALSLSENKQIIFKLHPNENAERASKEINKYAPGSIIYANGNTEHMIANCDILITKYSSVVYVGLALGKKVYSEFDIEDLKKLMPVQNGGVSAKNIAGVCVSLIEKKTIQITEFSSKLNLPDLKVNYQKT